MKKRDSLLLILSISCVSSLVGYSSWITGYKYSYSQTNKIQSIPVAYIVGKEDIKYTSIEKALDVAVSGDIVCVIAPQLANYNDHTNKILPDKFTYKISRNCTIKEGVTLFIPTDKASEGSVTNSKTLSTYIENLKKPKRDQGSSGYDSFAENDPSKYLRVSIEIEAGKTLTNNGTLLISGYLSGGTSNAGCVGQTSHSYSRIVLNEGSSIVQNNSNATTYCFGFIEEKTTNNNSVLDLQMGKLYIPVVINDYRGFTYSYAMTGGAIDNERCSVFNEMEFRNVKCLSKISYNSSVEGIINIYVNYSTLSVDETVTIEKGVIGSTNGYLIQQTESAYSHIVYKYDTLNNSFKAKCYGGFTFNYLSLDLSLKSQTLKLSTKNAYFPLSYKFDVELLCSENQSNAKFNITNQRMKIMTGSKIYIGDNVTLGGNELVVYSAFYDGEKGNGQGVLNSGRNAYPLKENGILQMADSAKISMNKIAGNIYCNNNTNISSSTTTITSKEPWNYGSSGSVNPPWTIKNYLELNESLNVVGTENVNKEKLCIGMNTFSNTNSYKPSLTLQMNNNTENIDINGIQRVVFSENISNFGFNLVSNVYRIYYNRTQYQMNSQVAYNSANRLIGIINSDRSISSNNNGINEFEIQKIEILGATHDVPQGTVLQLDKSIVDIEKAYDKKFEWSSLDTSICTVNQSGLVTGINVGKTSIKLSCGGKQALYEVNVTSSTHVEGVKRVEISESKGTASGGTFKDGTYVFNAKLIGENGNILSLDDISSITWIIKPEAPGRAYFDKDTNLVEKSGTISINVQINGGANANSSLGASPDNVYLTCKVIDKKGNEVSSQFHIYNDNACIIEGTEILMSDNTVKKVENIEVGDFVRVFNHETGKLDASPIIFITHKDEKPIICEVINLYFEENIQIKIAKEHALFDKTNKKYEIINKENFHNFIGHEFVIVKNDCIKSVALKRADITFEKKRMFCPVSAFHMNLFANNLLTMPTFPYNIRGLYNIFELDENLKYDENKKCLDIKKYGIYTHEEFSKLIFISKEAYSVSPAIYLKVSLGKGLITKDEIILGIKYLLNNNLIDKQR